MEWTTRCSSLVIPTPKWCQRPVLLEDGQEKGGRTFDGIRRRRGGRTAVSVLVALRLTLQGKEEILGQLT